MIERLKECKICPNNCKVNRLQGEIGKCKVKDKVKIALVSLHFFEEPCISGTNGSGTIFFSNCNINCKFCQNYDISQQGKGIEVSIEELSNIFVSQQEKGAENINLVTPTIYTYHIIEAIDIARKKGLRIPIIYNSNGYENIETLKLLEGYIDVYLPDLKYFDDDISFKYSNIKGYFKNASTSIEEMYRQVGSPILDEKGIIKKGLIIRHLVLPNNIENSKKILRWLKENIDKEVYISIMAQYFPTYLAKQDETINRKLNKREFKRIEDYLYELDLENGYIQDLGKHEEEYVPKFDLSGVKDE